MSKKQTNKQTKTTCRCNIFKLQKIKDKEKSLKEGKGKKKHIEEEKWELFFSKSHKMREFVASKPALQEILKVVLQREEK